MRSFTIVTILTLFIIAMDLYTYRGIQHLAAPSPEGNRLFTILFWGLTVVMFFAFLWAGSQFQRMRDPSRFFGVMLVMGIFLMFYIPKLVFNLTQLLGDITMLVSRLVSSGTEFGSIWKYFLIPGTVAGLLLFTGFGYGMLRGRTHVKVFRENIEIPGLPASFSGIKIVQLSDFHLAGFYNDPGHIRKVVSQVNQLDPDLILFTGDMVHNFSEEVDPFVKILGELDAPLGKFAVLGNHDYGHYFQWGSPEEERANL
ncbi:MAG: metallophosphoesterase, partial [Bacteroidales bacterium]|nr:metallophosphoesterase [Bacteroidales bacterium]